MTQFMDEGGGNPWGATLGDDNLGVQHFTHGDGNPSIWE